MTTNFFIREARFAWNELLAQLCVPETHETVDFVFNEPEVQVVAYTLEQVRPAIDYVEKATRAGYYAAGFVAYEAAPAFDSALCTHAVHDLPLMAFGLFRSVQSVPRPKSASTTGKTSSVLWKPALDAESYLQSVQRIKKYLADGHTYQVNFCFPLDCSSFEEAPLDAYRRLVAHQPADTASFLDCGSWAIVCTSPELFLELHGERLKTRPMKGTNPRGLWSSQDKQLAEQLRSSPKQKAENLMIVDLLRNDMGRISKLGSVSVERLFEIERYPTVWQMTSTITSVTDASLEEIFSALFPCGSVTGAPKVRTMEIIRELEPRPRWVYCGAVGWIAPGRRARFAVPIRTLVIDCERQKASYHVGSGIVIDSDPLEEYKECHSKARILVRTCTREFALLETLRWDTEGFWYLEEHLERLRNSADYFGYHYDEELVRRELFATARRLSHDAPWRVRLVLDKSGNARISSEKLSPLPTPMKVRLAARPIDPNEPLLYHKTTARTLYDEARQECEDCDDVILWNPEGFVTESTIANIVVDRKGELITPPLSAGLLPGIMREVLLREGRIKEAMCSVEELKAAEKVFLINSVRGWMPAVFAGIGA